MDEQFMNSDLHIVFALPFFLTFYHFCPCYFQLPSLMCLCMSFFSFHTHIFVSCKLMGRMELEYQVTQVASCQQQVSNSSQKLSYNDSHSAFPIQFWLSSIFFVIVSYNFVLSFLPFHVFCFHPSHCMFLVQFVQYWFILL